MKKLLTAVVLVAGTMLSGCAGSTATPSAVPTGSAKEQAGQIGQHYQEVADKVAPEVGAPIQQMAEIMKQVAASPTGTKTDEQTAQLTEQINKIGQYCK